MVKQRGSRRLREPARATEVDRNLNGGDGPRSETKSGRWWGRLAVNAFILWHLFALGIWLMPNSALRQDYVELVFPYLSFTGLVQNWSMFAPNPAETDVYVEARVM